MHAIFWLTNLKGKIHAEERDVNERIVLECMDWIHLAHDREQWRALVDTVMNFRVP